MLQILSRDFEPINYGFWRPLLRQLDEMIDAAPAQESSRLEQSRATYSPSCDVEETGDHYVINFDIPGVHRDDVAIELTGNRLVVSGERKGDGKSGGKRQGKFVRMFNLPEGVSADGVAADLRDGVLRLLVQKPSAAKPTKIKVGDGAGKPGFLKNFIGDKSKEAIDAKPRQEKTESLAMTN